MSISSIKKQNTNILNIDYNKEPNDITNIRFAPINKGGKRKKWYGNNEYVIKWHNKLLFLRNGSL